jgi:Mannosyltransferase putative
MLKLKNRKRAYLLLILIIYIILATSGREPRHTIRLKDRDTILIDSIINSNVSDPINFQKHGQNLRIFQFLYDNQDWLSKEDEIQLSRLSKRLFPWLGKSSLKTLEQSHKSRKGIVICGYDGGFEMTITLVKIIRKVYKSQLSIEIYYMGNSDLSLNNQMLLHQIPGVDVIDITKIFDNGLLQLKRWAIKPFAILASGFENVILMDCDVVLFQSPDEMFKQPRFISSGALFFYDRSMSDEVKDWKRAREIVVDLAGEFTPNLSQLRFFTGKTNYEMESGVVVIDKKRNFMGLVAICSLNSLREREIMYEVTYGEKETFWMGFEVVHIHYEFNDYLPGVIGSFSQITPNRICCKQILHLDYTGQPLWMNGGLRMTKASDSVFLKMEHYGTETDAKDNWVWSEGGVCLDLMTPHPLDATLLDTIAKMQLISERV